MRECEFLDFVFSISTFYIYNPPNFEDRIASDPTLLETFEIPTVSIGGIRNKLAKINKKLRDMYNTSEEYILVENDDSKEVSL